MSDFLSDFLGIFRSKYFFQNIKKLIAFHDKQLIPLFIIKLIYFSKKSSWIFLIVIFFTINKKCIDLLIKILQQLRKPIEKLINWYR